MLLVLTTAPNIDEAEALAENIIAARLAACVQIMPPMTSVYLWEGKVQKENEHLVLIKTLAEQYETLESLIKANHSYTVPEIVALEAQRISHQYVQWMKDVLNEKPDSVLNG